MRRDEMVEDGAVWSGLAETPKLSSVIPETHTLASRP